MRHPAALSKSGNRSEIERQTVALARALKVCGLMNVQFAVQDGDLRARSQSACEPHGAFRSQGHWTARGGNRCACHGGQTLAALELKPKRLDHIAVKEAVMPFARFPGVDTVLGPKCARPAKSWASIPISGEPLQRARSAPGPNFPERHGLYFGQGSRQGIRHRTRAAAH